MARHVLWVCMVAALLVAASAGCDEDDPASEAEALSEEAESSAIITSGEGLRIDGDTLVIEATDRRVPLEGARLVYGVHDGNIAIIDAGYSGGKITVLDADGDRVGGMELAPRMAAVLIDDAIVTYQVTGDRPGSPHVLTFHDLEGNPRATARQRVTLISATPDPRGNLRTLNTGGGAGAISYDAEGRPLGPDGEPELHDDHDHGEGAGIPH